MTCSASVSDEDPESDDGGAKRTLFFLLLDREVTKIPRLVVVAVDPSLSLLVVALLCMAMEREEVLLARSLLLLWLLVTKPTLLERGLILVEELDVLVLLLISSSRSFVNEDVTLDGEEDSE